MYLLSSCCCLSEVENPEEEKKRKEKKRMSLSPLTFILKIYLSAYFSGY
jgi:hypothetical protein